MIPLAIPQATLMKELWDKHRLAKKEMKRRLVERAHQDIEAFMPEVDAAQETGLIQDLESATKRARTE